MMLNEKLISGQFLLDLKNDRSCILPATAATHQKHILQPPSPPLPGLDIYSAYAYQQQLQQQLLNSHMTRVNPILQQTNAAEVLDLSRRELGDFARKTPSPSQTNSSLGSGSPAGSPNSSTIVQKPQLAPPLPNNLLCATQAYQQAQQVNNLSISANLAALYQPHSYYPAAVKQEPVVITPTPPKTLPVSQLAPAIVNNNILKTFAAAAATSHSNDVSEPLSPQPTSEITAATTPTSSNCNIAAHDTKNTRPFKAFPRDPLVIAANFAATDVLLDNPRVERYTEYRKRVLEQIRSSNGGCRTVTNPKMRRTNLISGSINEGSSSTNSENEERHHEESSDCDSNPAQDPQMSSSNSKPNDNSTANETNSTFCAGGIVKDAAYYERRRKNNAAAKKSRDRRRIKEDEIAIRAAYLERQNIELMCQIDTLKAQLATLTAKMA